MRSWSSGRGWTPEEKEVTGILPGAYVYCVHVYFLKDEKKNKNESAEVCRMRVNMVFYLKICAETGCIDGIENIRNTVKKA